MLRRTGYGDGDTKGRMQQTHLFFIVCGCSANTFDSLVVHSDARTAVCFPSADGFSLLSAEQHVDVLAGYSTCRSELSTVDFRTDRSKCCLWTNPLV